MTHVPGKPVAFDPPSEWRLAKDVLCRRCKQPKVRVREHESSCGGWEDYEYNCALCGETWWVDGIDS